jgi:hypothetical protein
MAPSVLHIAGRALWPLNGREVRLPAGAEAALLVRSDRWAEEDTLVPVSPAQEGRRTVAFTAPPENRIRYRIAVGEGVEAAPPVVCLENVAVTPVLLEDGSFEVSTSLAGRCRLEVDDVTIPVDLPADAPGLKDLGVIPGRDAVRVVRILRADGTPVTPEECGGVTPVFAPGEEESFVDTGPDGMVRIPPVPGEILLVVRPSDGFSLADLPFRVKLPARGPDVVKLPGGRISGDIRDPEGRAVPAVVYVDGYRFEAEEGRFDVGTVAAGPHVVIVGAEGRVGEARRILLADGESRSLSLDLPAR